MRPELLRSSLIFQALLAPTVHDRVLIPREFSQAYETALLSSIVPGYADDIWRYPTRTSVTRMVEDVELRASLDDLLLYALPYHEENPGLLFEHWGDTRLRLRFPEQAKGFRDGLREHPEYYVIDERFPHEFARLCGPDDPEGMLASLGHLPIPFYQR